MPITNSERALSMMVCAMYLAEKAVDPSWSTYNQILFGSLSAVALILSGLLLIDQFWTER